MDETTENAESMPPGEEAVEEAAAEQREPGCNCEKCCSGKCHGLCGGVFSGAIVGAALAMLLAHLKGEKSERIEQEGPLSAQAAKERASSVAGAVVSGAQGAWRTLRERLSDAWVEGKEGMTEGQAEARRKHDLMTRRGRHRR
ncbi:MAG: hypothetical protein ABSC13_08595 [Dehalococcoidia bacterium]|jgi:gas vesicle protein